LPSYLPPSPSYLQQRSLSLTLPIHLPSSYFEDLAFPASPLRVRRFKCALLSFPPPPPPCVTVCFFHLIFCILVLGLIVCITSSVPKPPLQVKLDVHFAMSTSAISDPSRSNITFSPLHPLPFPPRDHRISLPISFSLSFDLFPLVFFVSVGRRRLISSKTRFVRPRFTYLLCSIPSRRVHDVPHIAILVRRINFILLSHFAIFRGAKYLFLSKKMVCRECWVWPNQTRPQLRLATSVPFEMIPGFVLFSDCDHRWHGFTRFSRPWKQNDLHL